jgi:hypothetical protein
MQETFYIAMFTDHSIAGSVESRSIAQSHSSRGLLQMSKNIIVACELFMQLASSEVYYKSSAFSHEW